MENIISKGTFSRYSITIERRVKDIYINQQTIVENCICFSIELDE